MRIVASALSATYRDTDVIARIGGDEFVALSVHESESVALTATTSMQHRLAARLNDGSNSRAFDIHLSTGSAMSGASSESVESLLARVDTALYEAKRARGAHR